MSVFSMEKFQEQLELCNLIGCGCFVYLGRTYVQDGGARANRQGEPWEGAFGLSNREATDEEVDMWSALGGEPK